MAFLGIAYGIYMNAFGFHAAYPIIMSATIFAGSMEFVAVNLLLGSFNPIRALALTLMVNARHLFYGISMLDKYNGTGWKKYYLIFGMCDESFSINYTTDVPSDIDRGWFMFFYIIESFLLGMRRFYWRYSGPINTEGVEFVMTALFIVIFLEQWLKEKTHYSALLGKIIKNFRLYKKWEKQLAFCF